MAQDFVRCDGCQGEVSTAPPEPGGDPVRLIKMSDGRRLCLPCWKAPLIQARDDQFRAPR